MKKGILIFCLIFIFSLGYNFAQTIDSEFAPKFTQSGRIYSAANYLDEKILVAGSFSFIGDQPANSFARVLPDGSPDVSFNMDPSIIGLPNNFVTQSDGKILIAGKFYNTENEFLGNIIRLKVNGDIDESFQGIGNGEGEYFKMKLLPNQKILTAYKRCGQFNNVYSCLNYTVELFNADGSPDSNFTEVEFVPDLNEENELLSIAVQSNNSFVIVGSNLSIGNLTQNIVRLNADGTLDSDFNPEITFPSGYQGEFYDIDISPNGTIGVISPNGANVALLDAEGIQIQSTSLSNEHGQIVALSDNSFFICGNKVVRMFSNGEVYDIPGVQGFNWFLKAVAWGNGVIGAGFFTSIGGFSTNGIVNFDITNNTPQVDESFQPNSFGNGSIQNIVVQEDDKIVVSGAFNSVNGEPYQNTVRLNQDGSVDPTFNLESPAGANLINLKMQSDGSLIACFSNTLQTLRRHDKDGNLLEILPFPPHPGSNSGARYLSIDSEDKVYAGDRISFMTNGESSQGLKKYDFSQSIVEVTDYDDLYMDGLVRFNGLLTQQDDKLLIFGEELSYAGSSKTPIIRTELSGERDLGFVSDLPEDFSARALIEVDQNSYFISGSNSVEGMVFKLGENGEIDFSLSDDFAIDGNPTYFVNELFNLPYNLILANGSFNSFKNNPVSSQKVLMDVDGNYIAEFLPQIKAANINDVAFLNSTTVYIAGDFTNENSGSSLMRVSFLPTSIDEKNLHDNRLELFPNPTNIDYVLTSWPLALTGKEMSYSILETASGKLLRNGRVVIQGQTKIDLQDIPEGSYILRVKGEEETWSSKIIKFK